jgi:hypothetical protein
MIRFPHRVAPVGTIGFRGFTQAWIVRGDDLKQAGFHF